MASGDPVVQVLNVTATATSGATPDTIAGASTPAEVIPAWLFPDAASTYLDYLCLLKGYSGSGLTLKLIWAASVNSGNTVWQGAVRRIADDAEDLDSTSQTYDFNTVTGAAPSAVGEVSYDNLTFTSGADMDGLADGEMFVLRLLRDASHASDTMAGTAQFIGLIGYET